MNLDNTIKLKDGRTLGYAEFGNPKGYPVFYFHGWPVSRLSGKITDESAKELNLRIIAPDRPGIGLSDFQENRKILDWAQDVLELADFLNLKKFAVIGQSGGGPYAACVAFKIPERVSKVGILVGLGPTYVKGLLDGMSWYNKLGWRNYSKIPYLAELATFLHYLEAKLSLGFLLPYSFGAKSDQQVLSSKKSQKKLLESKKEVFRNGIKGASLELKLFTSDWGFDLTQIKPEVFLFYGTEDKNVPIAMGRYFKSKIKNSDLIEYPNEGHLISATHTKEILSYLKN